jgi:hypothetical protein
MKRLARGEFLDVYPDRQCVEGLFRRSQKIGDVAMPFPPCIIQWRRRPSVSDVDWVVVSEQVRQPPRLGRSRRRDAVRYGRRNRQR